MVVNGAPVGEKALQEKFMNNMKLASQWIIENGISAYTSIGTEGIQSKLIDDWAVQLWVVPPIVGTEDDREITKFWIKARGIGYEVLKLYYKRIDGIYYEFWLSKVTAMPWSGENTRSIFYIASADEFYGKREILLQSENFVSEFQTQDGNIIIFPSGDPELVYFMRPWMFPDSYKGTVLESKRAILGFDRRARFAR